MMEKRLSGWKRELLRAHGLIAGLFARSEPRALCLVYMQGLLSGCERKNGWQLAEWTGEIPAIRELRSSVDDQKLASLRRKVSVRRALCGTVAALVQL